MVGYTKAAMTFRPGDFCYIVAYNIMLADQQERLSFLEGMVLDVDQPPVPTSIYHPLWKFWGEKPEIRSISALVTADPRATQKLAVDPIRLCEEPQRDYLVIAPQEHEEYLYRVIEKQAGIIQGLEHVIERQKKMGYVQQTRIKSLGNKSHNQPRLTIPQVFKPEVSDINS